MNENTENIPEATYDRPATIGDMIRMNATIFVMLAGKQNIEFDLESSKVPLADFERFLTSSQPLIREAELIMQKAFQF